MIRRWRALAWAGLLVCSLATPGWAQDASKPKPGRDWVGGQLIRFNANGAWCWFQDERVIADPATSSLLIGSVANVSGAAGTHRGGDIDVTSYRIERRPRTVTPRTVTPRTVTPRTVTLKHGLENDDHAAPALIVRPDGRYLAVYTGHGSDRLVCYRVSRRPHDATSWRPEQVFDFAATKGSNYNVTYSNLVYLSKEKRLYDFVRATGRSPNILTSRDGGDTWRLRGRLTAPPRVGYVNGYFKYTSNGIDRIDVVATEHHPRDFNTSIYHGYIKAGRLHRTDGTVIDRDVFSGRPVRPNQLTPVRLSDAEDGGQRTTRAWPTDIQLDALGHPVITFSARADDDPVNTAGIEDHRFFYATEVGGRWRSVEVADAGPGLTADETDYTGLVAIDPRRTTRIYLSTPINPSTGKRTAHHEIYRGLTDDRGRTWVWRAITRRSTVDNLRPVVPDWPGHHAVLWLRGTYTTFLDYDLEVVGLLR